VRIRKKNVFVDLIIKTSQINNKMRRSIKVTQKNHLHLLQGPGICKSLHLHVLWFLCFNIVF